MKKLSILLLALIIGAGTIFASDTSVDGIWYNFDVGTLTAEVTYRGPQFNTYTNEYSGEVVIPASVTYNANTYNVTSIGEYAFANCTALTSVTIPNSVTSIIKDAFSDCTGLTSVTIGNSVTSIGISAFSRCTGLTSVTIPNSVTSLGNYAFKDCLALTSVTIPNSVTSIGDGAFYQCTNLTSVTIPNSVIGSSAFYGCSGLTSVTIGNSVTSIGDAAFWECSGLTSLTIGNSVTSIGNYAFRNCSGLTSVTNYATTPQAIDYVFYNVNKSTCKLYVPLESFSAYQSAANWSDFQIGGAAMTAKADPDDASTFYTTFYHGSQKYKLSVGMEAYTATINGDVLELSKVAEGGDVIPAGTAFILKSNAANLTMDATDETPVSVGENILQGVDAATSAPANCYVLSGKSSDNSVQGIGFYRFSGTLSAHKAYLTIASKAGAPRRLRFSFSETNATTAVDQVQGNKVQGTKILENGQLYIMYNGTKYNVQGSRVH